ncbi:MAG TPA: sulfatase [Erysipelotrichaceae bacterium]|nr:sulfatase [Erysipelotrichaceae bacterium]
MKAVMIMYDSLNRRYLSPYGNKEIITPNFARLAEHSVTFDNFFTGSMPCMPARRELHTGRLNFLHRSWSPFEPFDESMPRMLGEHGIWSHLVTDHCHYWEAGGANYWTNYSSFEFVRGQEGDQWKSDPDDFDGPLLPRQQDQINRRYMCEEAEYAHARSFEKGMEFLREHSDSDHWFLQLEYFDPHEPFFVPERFTKLYSDQPVTDDWPEYRVYTEEEHEKTEGFRTAYKALVTMCDEYLGKILDFFDEHDLWKDTMLIVNTDHGFMLGEKGYFGKNYPPVYDELANIPFFLHDPRHPEKDGTRCCALAQTPDIAPTVLDFFGIAKGAHMTGESVLPLISGEKNRIHDSILYGYYGMHVNVTDGQYTYMRSAQTEDNKPLYQYTLMPAHIKKYMHAEEVRQADDALCRSLEFADHIPVLRIPTDEKYDRKRYYSYSGHRKYGTMLFDRISDPFQEHPLHDPETENMMKEKLIREMKIAEAPEEQYVRLGLKTE